jgi:hypothetical protein
VACPYLDTDKENSEPFTKAQRALLRDPTARTQVTHGGSGGSGSSGSDSGGAYN